MKSNRKLKTVERWIEAHPDLIEEHWIEHDECDPDSPWSYWIYLRPGYWNPSEEIHCIHEAYAKEIISRLNAIEPCRSTEDCGCPSPPPEYARMIDDRGFMDF
jgi:hypothetical protein